MKNDQHPDTSSEPSPELYALGALSESERETFEEFVAEGFVDMENVRSHLESFTAVCEEVAETMPAPRRALKEQILAAALADDGATASISAAAAVSHAQEPPEQLFIHAHQGEWIDTGIPGIALKILYIDAESGRTTLLARLAPGSVYPRHRHRGVEECLVVEGDLFVDGVRMGAGDFTLTRPEKVHVDTHTEEGCLLLLSSPMNDEFFGDAHDTD